MTELQKLITRIRVDADTLDGIAKHLDELAERDQESRDDLRCLDMR